MKFEKNLTRLCLVLEKLGSLRQASRIIWLNQYPTLDFFSETAAYNAYINSDMLEHYNAIARRIFRCEKSFPFA